MVEQDLLKKGRHWNIFNMIQETCCKCLKEIKKICYSSKKGWLCSKCNDIEIKDEKSIHNQKNSSSK